MNFKIKITSPEHSKSVQEAVFKLGGNWFECRNKNVVQYTDKGFLYLLNGAISFGDTYEYFSTQYDKEMFLQPDGTFAEKELKVQHPDNVPPFAKMRIEILNTYHSERVQAALFKLGYKWYDCPFGVAYHKDKKWLWAGACGSITYSHCAEVGDSDNEYALVDLAWLDKMVAEKDMKDKELEKELRKPLLEEEYRTTKEKMEKAMKDRELQKKYLMVAKTPDEGSKGENPKQSVGNLSIPVTALSPLACALGAIGKLNGSLKYGSSNYIGTEVVMSVYLDAIRRHLDKIVMGETVDEDDGVPHFAAIMANCDIIVSAQAAGTLIDNRVRADGQIEAVKALKPLVASLQELHKGKNPRHYLMVNKDGIQNDVQ